MRSEHSAPVIGESLYLWAGNQFGFPYVHDSLQKTQLVSTVEIFSFSSGRWSSQPTKGVPPRGVIGYSCTTVRSGIYYYGGGCGHGHCYHNSLNLLDTLDMSWKSLAHNNKSMNKGYGGMVSLALDESEFLFIVGGIGSTPTISRRQFQYHKLKDGHIRTNEQLLYNLSTGKII